MLKNSFLTIFLKLCYNWGMCWPRNLLQILLVFPTKFVKHEEATVYSLALIVIILAAILNHHATHKIHCNTQNSFGLPPIYREGKRESIRQILLGSIWYFADCGNYVWLIQFYRSLLPWHKSKPVNVHRFLPKRICSVNLTNVRAYANP